MEDVVQRHLKLVILRLRSLSCPDFEAVGPQNRFRKRSTETVEVGQVVARRDEGGAGLGDGGEERMKEKKCEGYKYSVQGAGSWWRRRGTFDEKLEKVKFFCSLKDLEEQTAMCSKERSKNERLDGHELDKNVQRRPRCVLERVAHSVAYHSSLVRVRSFWTKSSRVLGSPSLCIQKQCISLEMAPPVLDADIAIYTSPKTSVKAGIEILAFDFGALIVSVKDSLKHYLYTRDEGSSEDTRQGFHAKEDPDNEGSEHDKSTRRDHLLDRGISGDLNAGGIVGLGCAFHEAGDGHQRLKFRPGSQMHQTRRETQGQQIRWQNPENKDINRRPYWGRNAKTVHLSNSCCGVSSSIKGIGSLTDSVAHASHLSNSSSIVTDGTICINSQTSSNSAQHSKGSNRNAIHCRKAEADKDADRYGKNGNYN
nr:inorganic pyrophosphatase [Ipomoea batatas]